MITVRPNRGNEGGCNFCDARTADHICQSRDPYCTLVVRICERCALALAHYVMIGVKTPR